MTPATPTTVAGATSAAAGAAWWDAVADSAALSEAHNLAPGPPPRLAQARKFPGPAPMQAHPTSTLAPVFADMAADPGTATAAAAAGGLDEPRRASLRSSAATPTTGRLADTATPARPSAGFAGGSGVDGEDDDYSGDNDDGVEDDGDDDDGGGGGGGRRAGGRRAGGRRGSTGKAPSSKRRPDLDSPNLIAKHHIPLVTRWYVRRARAPRTCAATGC